jgi:hypothetical protein
MPQKVQDRCEEEGWGVDAGMARAGLARLRARRWLSSFWKADWSLARSRESIRRRDEAKLLYSAGKALIRAMQSSSWSKSIRVNVEGLRALTSWSALSALAMRVGKLSSASFRILKRAS